MTKPVSQSHHSSEARLVRRRCFTHSAFLLHTGRSAALRRLLVGILVVLFTTAPRLATVAQAQAKKKAAKPAGVDNLLDPKKFSMRWTHHSGGGEKTPLNATWTLDAKTDEKNPVLKCTGKPSGYLRTTKVYENFELTLEWMYHDEKCNSGILIHTNGGDKVWPGCIQFQLHRPKVGMIYPLKPSKTDFEITPKPPLKLATKKWHSCKITSLNGSITVVINGKTVGTVTGCVPSKGYIALQSQGSEIHFRAIKIREIKAPAKK